MNALTITTRDLAGALSMLPRRKPVSEIVRNVFEAECGPIPEGTMGRGLRSKLRRIGIWACRELNFTDAEISREFGASIYKIEHAVRLVSHQRMNDPHFRKLTAIVLAELENA